MELKLKNPAHTFREVMRVLLLIQEWRIKSKTVMSWSSREKKMNVFL